MSLAERIVSRGDIPRDYRFEETHITEVLAGGRIAWKGETVPSQSPVPLRRNDGLAAYALPGSFPACDEEHAMLALDAALEAWDEGDGIWPSMSMEGRAMVLHALLERIRPLRERIASHIMWGVGKAWTEALNEFDRTLEYAADTIRSGMELQQRMRTDQSLQQVTGRAELQPIGVALCVGPYNYPFYETLTNVIPALLTGNTVIVKAPTRGELLYAPLLPIFDKLLPQGALNMVFGDGEMLLPPLMRSGKIDVFAFIGTSRVADALIAEHPCPHRLHSILGLEAKNMAMVLPDAPMEHTVAEIVKGALAFNGQRCAALKLIAVHESIEAEFLEQLRAAVSPLLPGMPWENSRVTPVISADHAEYLERMLEEAVHFGARIVNEDRPEPVMTLYPPALLADVTADMRIAQEEQFGPIIPVMRITSADEAVSMLKSSRYGQQLSVFSSSATALREVTRTVARYVGRINVNGKCQRGPDHFPFTGRRDSALATVSIEDALLRFSVATVTAVPETEDNLRIWQEMMEEEG
ncbi:MAG: aldehyde dehydrogenase family protein [Bacteroidia bacterium]|nr:aldehyde dehydrogenase family protein [Bacteroidia bacterium]